MRGASRAAREPHGERQAAPRDGGQAIAIAYTKPTAAARLYAGAHAFLESRAPHPFVADCLARLPEPHAGERPLSPIPLPVLACLAATMPGAAPDARALVGSLIECAAKLAWRQSYTRDDVPAQFLERYGFTELAGPRGPFASAEVACGLLLLGPETEYPLHAHRAEEAYVVLSGIAEWRRRRERTRHLPGALIHHPPGVPHAMRTEAAPLLLLYLWRGAQLTQKSTLIEPARAGQSGD